MGGITDELREFASHCAGGMGGDALRHIADNIDAEHKRNMILAVDCIETLCAKNAKLRELCADMLSEDMDQHWPEFTRRALELGVEVER